MDTLSPEVLSLILAWLPPVEVLNARCVCTRWRTLCEQIVHQRCRSGGPFIQKSRHDHDCVFPGTLPVFATSNERGHTAPSIARADHADYCCSLMAPFVRAKLTQVVVERNMDWSTPMLRPGILPRLESLHAHSPDLVAGLPNDPWWRVTTLTLCGLTFVPPLLDAFPSCRRLILRNCRLGHAALAMHVPPRRVEVFYNEMPAVELARPIAEMCLVHVKLTDPGRLLTQTISHGYWPVHAEDVWADGNVLVPRFLLHCPALEDLDVSSAALENADVMSELQGERVVLSAPGLRRLELRGEGTRILVDTLTMLECASFGRIVSCDFAWLAGQPLRALHLDLVSTQNLDFLAACSMLETLTLDDIQMPARAVPFAALPRLKTLKIVAPTHDTITNLSEIGLIATLEVLILHDIDSLRSIAFVASLPRLRRLRLRCLNCLASLDGVQRAAALAWLTVESSASLTDVDALQDLRRVDKLKLRYMAHTPDVPLLSVRALDLSRTPATVLVLHRVACWQMLRRPPGLRTLTVYNCQFGAGANASAELLAPLGGLRRVYWSCENNILHAGLRLSAPTPLRALSLAVKGVSAGAFDALRAAHVEVNFDADMERESLAETARLAPTSLCARLRHLYDASIWQLFAPTLQALDVSYWQRAEMHDIDGLAALLRLERLKLGFVPAGSSLHALRGHPALRELTLRGNGALDIAPLLTCPRLAVVHLDGCAVPPEQVAALRAHIESQTQ